jgi:hypothetical protein
MVPNSSANATQEVPPKYTGPPPIIGEVKLRVISMADNSPTCFTVDPSIKVVDVMVSDP